MGMPLCCNPPPVLASPPRTPGSTGVTAAACSATAAGCAHNASTSTAPAPRAIEPMAIDLSYPLVGFIASPFRGGAEIQVGLSRRIAKYEVQSDEGTRRAAVSRKPLPY